MQASAGPLVMPWHTGHLEEIIIYAIVGVIGAIIGATAIHHYRAAQGRA